MTALTSRFQQYLEDGTALPESSFRYFCYFGISVVPPIQPDDVKLLALAAAGRFLATGNKLNMSSVIRSDFENEELHLIGNFSNLDQTDLTYLYKEHFNSYLNAFTHSGLPTLNFFNLSFKPEFSRELIRVLAHNFHDECRKTHALFDYALFKNDMQGQVHERYSRIEREQENLFESMAAFLDHDEETFQKAQAVFWEECHLLNEMTGLNQQPYHQRNYHDDFELSNGRLALITLLLFVVITIVNILLVSLGGN